MEEIKNTMCFEYKGIKFNVPIKSPWNVYTGDKVVEGEEYMDSIDRSKDDPFFILHLTERCNLSCDYCFEKIENEDISCRRDMSNETIDDFVDYILKKRYKRFSVRFFGGEPTLKEDLIKYTINKLNSECPKEKGYEISYNIFTNAVILDKEFIEYIVDNNIGCFVSVDGCKKMHDYNRKFLNGKGSYDLVIGNAKKLRRERKGNLVLRGIYDIDVKDVNLIDFVDNIFNNGFDLISLEIPWVSNTSTLAYNDEKLIKFKKYISDYTDECVKRLENNDFSLIALYEIAKNLKKLSFKVNPLFPDACAAGDTTYSIDIHGDIYPCHSFINNKDYKLGNIKEGITNEELNNKFIHYSGETVPKCKECAFKYYCTKRCIADSLFFNNNCMIPNDYRCEIEKEFFKSAIYIYYKILNFDESLLKKIKLYLVQFHNYNKYK